MLTPGDMIEVMISTTGFYDGPKRRDTIVFPGVYLVIAVRKDQEWCLIMPSAAWITVWQHRKIVNEC